MSGRIAEDELRRLVPLESYRSPWVPTKRLGVSAVVAVADPTRSPDSRTSVQPSKWFAAEPDLSRLLVFAESRVISPVPEFRPGLLQFPAVTLHPREGLAILRELLPSAGSAFFSNLDISSDAAASLGAAFEATLPARLLPWVRLCCSDFFRWLEAPGLAEGIDGQGGHV